MTDTTTPAKTPETADAATFWTDMEGRAATWATRHPAALRYVEDYERERQATMRDPDGRAVLETACRQASVIGQQRGGQRCCGTTGELHRPWCRTGPRRYRAEEAIAEP
jgi:hypothetical protein